MAGLGGLARLLSLSSAAGVLMAATTVSWAQNATISADGSLEEITVTAQRREQRLQEVPIAVTAITGNALQLAGVDGALELGRVTPGLVAYRIGSAFLPYIRGVGSNQPTNGFESPVAIYLDGVYQAHKNSNVLSLNNIERVEVLKGPQGTLFGRNATGGAISVITRAPDGAAEAMFDIGYGSRNEHRARAYIGGALSDTFSASFAASGVWSDGYIKDLVRGGYANPSDDYIAMVKLMWKPSERFKATLSASYSYYENATALSTHVMPGTLSQAESLGFISARSADGLTTSLSPLLQTDATRATLHLQYDFETVRLVSITGYVDGGSKALADSDASTGNLQYSAAGQPGEEWSQEVQIQSLGEGPFSWILGGYYMSFTEGFDDAPNNLLAATNLPFPVRPEDLSRPGASAVGISSMVDTTAAAAFAEFGYDLTDRLSATVGVRYNYEEKSIDNGRLFLYSAVPDTGQIGARLNWTAPSTMGLVFSTIPLASMSVSKDFSEFTWRGALDYQVTDDVMVYASYNRGFKSGGFNPTVINPAQQPVNPEIIDAFEVGVKSELLGRRLRLNASAFYYDYRDIQVALITGVGVSTVQNAAEAELYGLDIDFVAQLSDRLTLRGGVNFLDTQYNKYERAQIFLPKTGASCPTPAPLVSMSQAKAIAAAVPTGGNCSYALDAAGQDLIFSPPVSGNVAVEYDIPFADDSRLTLNASLFFTDGFDVSPGGINAHIDGYATLAAAITWSAPGDRYFVRIWGENLTDSDHYTLVSPGAAQFGVVNAAPPSIGITFGANFGL